MRAIKFFVIASLFALTSCQFSAAFGVKLMQDAKKASNDHTQKNTNSKKIQSDIQTNEN